MRFSILLALAALVFSSGASLADFSPADSQALARISARLNAIHSLKAQFVQTDPDGRIERGELYIEKPGRMRFEYAPPSVELVVSDGVDVAVFNKQLHTASRYPLRATPLGILLSDKVDLADNPDVVGVDRRSGAIIVHARSNDRRATANIAIVFSGPGLELRQWTVTDAQGLSTTVSLRDVQAGVSISPQLFLTHGPSWERAKTLNPYGAK